VSDNHKLFASLKPFYVKAHFFSVKIYPGAKLQNRYFKSLHTASKRANTHHTLLRQRSRCKINQQALGSEPHLHLKHLIFRARLPAKAGGGTFALSPQLGGSQRAHSNLTKCLAVMS
jgi:hypothetical protein